MSRQQGFTLIEVLVALAVVAIALGALIQSMGSYAGNIAYLRDRTYASWVATDVIREQQLVQSWPKTGNSSGDIEMLTRKWYWRLKVSTTPDPNVRRMDVEVRLDPDDKQALSSLIGYAGKY